MMLSRVTLCFLFLLFLGCFLDGRVSSEIDRFPPGHPELTLKIWMLSDIQPVDRKQRREFEEAISDINRNVPGIDLAIVAGDIVDAADERDFDWYNSEKSSSYIKEWYEIAGNHDLKLDRGEGYKRKIRRDFYYSFTKGNILFILMSDEKRGKATEISDEAFRWWRNLVINNQDKIIVVVTHAPLEGSGIPFSTHRDRQIKDSRRFTEVLRMYRVDMWISGHLHIPHSLANNIVRSSEYKGALFINVSSIRTELMGIKPSESRIVTFTCGSNKVVIRSRNHTNRRYERSLDAEFRLSKEYRCGVDGRPIIPLG